MRSGLASPARLAPPTLSVERISDLHTDRPVVPSSLGTIRRAVSYRRHLLDAYLEWAKPLMRGTVIDLGGKRDRKRGTFRPPANESVWTYVNIDPATNPDLLCDVTAVPRPDAAADCVLCTVVLEHLADPTACVREAHRLLRDNGVMIASVPFMYPVHADPHDFSRFTADGLRRLFGAFSSVRVIGMGGFAGTLGMFLESGGRRMGGGAAARVGRRVLFESGRLLQWWDARQSKKLTASSLAVHTTGYFIIARK